MKWYKISLFFFLIVALIGTLLRASSFVDIPLQYSHLVHSHSHVAFQGWIYTIMLLLLPHLFLDKDQAVKGRYSLQYKLTIAIIFCILISFSFQGYGLYSILCSSIFQLFNYWFIYRFYKDSKALGSKSISIRFVRTGLWLGLISTIAPLGVGILSAKGLNGSEAYNSFIYSFLHFQYNGWFLFVAIGILFKLLESENISFNQKSMLIFYWMFTIAVIPALSLSFLGMSFRSYIIIPAYISVICQLVGMIFLSHGLKPLIRKWLLKQNKWVKMLLGLSITSLYLKVILQSLSVFTTFESYAFSNHNIILAYLHLIFIGMLSFLFLAILIKTEWISISRTSQIGLSLLILGFITTEGLLMLDGLGLYYDATSIFIGSLFMVFGILLLILNPRKSTGQNGRI